MSCLGNLIWFTFGGFLTGASWAIVGVIWCMTIIGIPIGMQCFKFALLSFCPFGKYVEYGGGVTSLILNILWIIFGGIPLAIEHITFGIIFAITIVGIPFAKQHFKLAKLALMPFGSSVY